MILVVSTPLCSTGNVVGYVFANVFAHSDF